MLPIAVPHAVAPRFVSASTTAFRSLADILVRDEFLPPGREMESLAAVAAYHHLVGSIVCLVHYIFPCLRQISRPPTSTLVPPDAKSLFASPRVELHSSRRPNVWLPGDLGVVCYPSIACEPAWTVATACRYCNLNGLFRSAPSQLSLLLVVT